MRQDGDKFSARPVLLQKATVLTQNSHQTYQCYVIQRKKITHTIENKVRTILQPTITIQFLSLLSQNQNNKKIELKKERNKHNTFKL